VSVSAGEHRFRADFVWGAATSAYQIEGSPLADGAGMSNWHRFAHTPGRTHEGETGDIACDHYRRWPDDVALMRTLGLRGYRMSLSWPRIFPEGRGAMNPRGLDFYSRLVDALLGAGITPFVTLFHWDLPAALEDRGGWLNPDSAGWFADYAAAAVGALGDRVASWMTLNEPGIVVDAGYLHGVNAPGRQSVYEAPIVARHLMIAHGTGVQAIRAQRPVRVGLAVDYEPKTPASGRAEDVEAVARGEAYTNQQYLDPALLGRVPEKLAEVYGNAWRPWSDEELARSRQPLDFLGVNYYTRCIVRDEPGGLPPRTARVRNERALHTETDWEVYPEGLTATLLQLRARYGAIPLYVTENGAAFPDPPQASGGVLEDPLRARYYWEHLRAVREAMRRGVDVRGYFAWSLLDNIEWAQGTSKRFGIVHVNFETQERTIKRSGRYYAEVIASDGAVLAEEPVVRA
jgi:beta-glucosidase